MAGDRHNREERNIALLDEARKRRAQQPRATSPVAVTDECTAAAENSFGYTLDLAGTLDEPPANEPTAGGADEVLAQHQAPPTTEPGVPPERPFADGAQNQPAVALSDDAPVADEVLEAISAHHERERPSARHAAPRGSADLEPIAPRRRRSHAASSIVRENADRGARVPRWLLGAAAVLAILIAVPLFAIAGAGPRARSGAPRRVDAAGIGAHSVTLPKVTPAEPTVDRRTSAHGTTRHARRHKTREAAHHRASTHRARSTTVGSQSAARPASGTPVAAPVSSSTYSSGSTGSSGSSGSRYTSPAATSSQSGASAPAGPSGTAGGTVGGNCNPKCS